MPYDAGGTIIWAFVACPLRKRLISACVLYDMAIALRKAIFSLLYRL